jgi:RES domain-containing protein
VSIDPRRVATAPLASFKGSGWRHLAPRYDPLSGEGARLNGGRFNPPGSFPVLYLCLTRDCAVAEMRRLARRQALTIDDLLPRHLYRYAVSLHRVLYLVEEDVRDHVGVALASLTGPEWTACQELGSVAHSLGIQAVLSPSATGADDVLALFLENLGVGKLEMELREEWSTTHDLDGPG